MRFAISGGGALLDNVDSFFDIAGILVCEGYGLTETAPVLSARNPEANIISSVGAALPEVEIKVVDKNDIRKELPYGEVGVVLTKGPMVMKGYYKTKKPQHRLFRMDGLIPVTWEGRLKTVNICSW